MPERDHRISLEDACVLTHQWQADNATKRFAWSMSLDVLKEIMAQPGCAGIRVYKAGPATDETLVIIGVDENGSDMVKGPLCEQMWPCPPYCPEQTALRR